MKITLRVALATTSMLVAHMAVAAPPAGQTTIPGPPPVYTNAGGSQVPAQPTVCMNWDGTLCANGSQASPDVVTGSSGQPLDQGPGAPTSNTLRTEKAITSYTLSTGATSAGAIKPDPNGYTLSIPVLNGATVTFTSTAQNGNTSTQTYTAQPITAPGVCISDQTTVQVTVSGGTPSGSVTLNGNPQISCAGQNGIQQVAGVTPAYTASSATTVSGTFTTSTTAGATSAAFTPVAGRAFNIAVWASTTPGSSLGGTVYLIRSIDGGATYLPLTASGTQLESFTTTTSDSWSESQTGVTYELVCASVPTGTINYRVSQ